MTNPSLTQLRRRPIDQLYHQFLKPKDIPRDKLAALIQALQDHNFISTVLSTNLQPQYVESDKLTSGQNKDELFKIIQSIKES